MKNTITTIKENGSLNINNNNLTTDSQFNGERYNCDLFNGKNVFYLSKSDSTTSVIECTLTEAQLSRITKGSYYTFGIFFKSLSESIIKPSISITLLNGSNEIASKTFNEMSDSQILMAQIKLLEAQNKRLEMENDFLKKLAAFYAKEIK